MPDERLIVHSTAPFSEGDVKSLRELGTPAWLIEATGFHDTYTQQGLQAFSDARILAPDNFPKIPTERRITLDAVREAWPDELEILPLGGMPGINEHVFFHSSSRTLIVADLIFNFSENSSWWTRTFVRCAAGIKEMPGISRIIKFMIKDKAAFEASLRLMFQWEFDRVIMAHGEIIERGGKEALRQLFGRHGFAVS